eukprot:gene24138-biopygen2884
MLFSRVRGGAGPFCPVSLPVCLSQHPKNHRKACGFGDYRPTSRTHFPRRRGDYEVSKLAGRAAQKPVFCGPNMQVRRLESDEVADFPGACGALAFGAPTPQASTPRAPGNMVFDHFQPPHLRGVGQGQPLLGPPRRPSLAAGNSQQKVLLAPRLLCLISPSGGLCGVIWTSDQPPTTNYQPKLVGGWWLVVGGWQLVAGGW